MSLLSRFLSVAVSSAVFFCPVPRATSEPLSINQLLDIRHPSDPVWSPDGKHIVYLWDRCDVVNLYLADASGGTQPRALTHFSEGRVANVFWSHDGGSVYFVRSGKLWNASTPGENRQLPGKCPTGLSRSSQLRMEPESPLAFRTERAAVMPSSCVFSQLTQL